MGIAHPTSTTGNLTDSMATFSLGVILKVISQLCHAIVDYDVSKIKKIINRFDIINEYSDEYSTTPLIQAIDLKQVETVRLLLDSGADFQLTFWDFTPLGLAVSRGNLEIVKLLLNIGADPSIGGEEPPLSSAIN
ncbi:ankyrin repeat domain-containing protein [Lusitaniella coriacea LEGE 07157]|uniref:Ankyrin repeat domain-containing protein n=1 Tax=Lusitaniella coriacea LEGE 07157 TaxID=945747 RepID=A0A8J7J6U2_9CYAN|nr:ankyrin repeat domain-containing protein [Lusitaniella coriacea]MBE9118939.1 ankyrin repeat domain-containing protein [Lusitaniella coriacea LEGE 07157]